MQPVSAGAQPQELAYCIIPLSKGKFAKISPEDLDRVSQHRWYAQKADKSWRAKTAFTRNGKITNFLMHRFILGLADPNVQVDHRNGDGLDNTRSNLRTCNCSQNNANRGKLSTNTSGLKGVYWHRENRKWFTNIMFHKKTIYIGSFDDPNEAHSAYVEKAKELFGEFFHP